MRFDIFTLFSGIFESPLKESMLKRAIDSGLLDVQLHNIRDYAEGRHQVTDDYPYGGGGGMVMKPEPVFSAVETVLGMRNSEPGIRNETNSPFPIPDSPLPIVLLTPQGRLF